MPPWNTPRRHFYFQFTKELFMPSTCYIEQQIPLNLIYRKARRSHLPNYPRSNPYTEINYGHRF